VREGLTAMSAAGPGPLTAALKLLGLGSAAGGGAASSGAAAGGGAIVVAGGGTAVKVTAVVCCAALAAGGAAEVTHQLKEPLRGSATGAPREHATPAPTLPAKHGGSPASTAAAAGTPRSSSAHHAATGGTSGAESIRRSTASPTRVAEAPGSSTPRAGAADQVTGGAAAPNEDDGFGHGVDGLTPSRELPPGGTGAPDDVTANGGSSGPTDQPGAAPATAAPTVASAP
jgi:hypothetical protein